MFVTKRNQYSEEFDINKVKKVISWATKGLNVESLELEAHVDIIFKDGISTKEIQDNLIQHSLRLTSIESPDWRIVAGRLNLMSVWKEYTLPYQQFAANMVSEGKYHPSTIEFTDDEFEALEEAIDSSRDLVYDYAGSQVLLKKYIYKDEPIQYMYMATAARLASHEDDKLFWTLEFYNALSNREISLATPLLSGARKNSENLSSCFETKFEDSLEDIFKALADIGRISKNGGGVGTNISSIRASDSWVAGRAGASNGIVPWIKLINDTAIAVNQLGSRAAAITVALDVWHYDLEKFLNIGTEHGEMRNKAFDIFPQLVIPDVFMRMAKQDSSWYMFDPYEVKKVLGVDLVNTHNAEFEQGYAACCLAADAGKLTLVNIKPAKEILKLILKTQVETSLPYLFFKDKVNRLNPNNHAGLILNANLCVSGDTKILTDDGYKEIGSLYGKEVNCWNGREFSTVHIVKTNDEATLLELQFSNGESLKCTPYHKFYIKDGYRGRVIEKRAFELTTSDKLIKYDLPFIAGTENFLSPYENGLFTADGSVEADKDYYFISLYGAKIDLLGNLNPKALLNVSPIEKGVTINGQDRIRIRLNKNEIMPKFTVPSTNVKLDHKLKWLAGLLDGDGCVYRNGTNEQLVLSSSNLEFLRNIRLFLQELGIDSKITVMKPEGKYLLPTNNKSEDKYALYDCKTSYRLIISSVAVYKLNALGLQCYRLKLTNSKPQRDATRFVTLTSKVELPGLHTTYCGTEPKRNMLMFNGILTGNCVESFSNTSLEEHHVCSLSSPNLAYITPERLSYVCKLTTRLLDNVIDLTSEPTKEASTHTLKYRTIGVGALGLADYLVREGMTYESAYKQGILSDIFEEMCIACIEESIDLAEERGRYPAFTGSQWDTGSRIDTFKQWSKFPAQWDNLQDRINKSGIRNSQLMSPAPNTSTSLLQNATASVLPPFNVFFYNSSSEGMVPIIPPYLNQDTLLLYKKYSNFDMSRMIDYMEHICRWIDTGLSFELMYDLNNPVVTAKYMYDNIFKVWESPSIKTMYYIRFVQKDGTTTEKEECVACAG